MVRAFAEGDVEHMLLAVPALIMIGGTLSFGRRINRLVTEAISKRFENEALVTALSAQTAIAEQARATAEAANRSKTRFFAAASHDLRQPLHALGLFASALQAKVRDPEVAHMVHSINGSVEALDGLFNELLDISKIDAGVIKPVLTVFPVKHLIDRLRLDFGAEAHAMGLRFHARASGAWISSDPLLLERILRNLISNALRYTRQGGVVLGCRRRGNDLSIEVWDSGIGIAPEQIDRVFEEFYQVGNAERSSKKGLGLGLSIVKRLSGLLGASLRLRSRAGRGSVFAITLPLAAAPAVSAPAASVRASAAAGSDFSGRLMVVIDDEEAIVDGMRVLLDSWGAAVIASTDGADVIAQVHRHGRLPDLIIADYRLAGGLIGTDLIERLQQELDPAIPAILVTGSTTPERVEEATRKGYHLLLKPVTPERLRQLIRFKLDGKGGP